MDARTKSNLKTLGEKYMPRSQTAVEENSSTTSCLKALADVGNQ